LINDKRGRRKKAKKKTVKIKNRINREQYRNKVIILTSKVPRYYPNQEIFHLLKDQVVTGRKR
jgi:hypothetical protein